MMLTYNGSEIQQRELDGYVNITQMAKANEVRFADWLENQTAKDYLKALQESIYAKNGNIEKLIITQGFGIEKTQWAHPLVAIAFGQWISPQFHVWCNIHIKILMETGETSLATKKQTKIKELENTISLTERVTILESQIPSVLHQILLDQIADVCLGKRGLLNQKTKMGVAQRAEELGYEITIHNRSVLGKDIAKKLKAEREKRLCNGELRFVNVYTVNDELDNAIHDFFEQRNIAILPKISYTKGSNLIKEHNEV